MARTAKDSDSLPPSFGAYPDLPWLGMGTLVSWLIILPATILGLTLGDSLAWRSVSVITSRWTTALFFVPIHVRPRCVAQYLDRLCSAVCTLSNLTLVFSISHFHIIKDSMLSLVGGVLFLASGSCCIDYNSGALGDKWDIAMALGSLAIITGGCSKVVIR